MALNSSIQALIAGKHVAGSKLSNKIVDELMAEGLLSVTTHGSKKSYQARDPEAIKRHLTDKNECYRIPEADAYDTRASMATKTGNSKLYMVRTCPGFPINSYEPIECSLNGEPFMVSPPEGSFLFISDWKTFTIPKDAMIIGVENMENFRMIRNQRPFFEEYLHTHGFPEKVIFVSRYPQSTDLRNWLCTISNHYLHFGDFDLAGINIFLSEFQQHLGKRRSSFLIPNDIESRLKSGSIERYDEQLRHFKDLKSDIHELQQLIGLIHNIRKTYDQEGYISI